MAAGVHRPAFAIFACNDEPIVVVAVRGTSNLKELITDLVCEPKPLPSEELPAVREDGHQIFVHEGMWHSLKNVAEALEEPLMEILASRPKHRVLFTGHSLGAAVATLLCLHWRPRFGAGVSAVVFAPPQILDLASAREAEKQGVISVVTGSDLVPRLSMHSAVTLAHRAAQLAHEQASQDREAPVPPENLTPLYPAGRLLLLPRNGPPTAKIIDQTDLDTIRICSTMLSNHMQPVYLKSLGVTA